MADTLNGKAEKTKRQLLQGKLCEVLGTEKALKVMQELKPAFDQIDEHYKNKDSEPK